MLTATDSSNLQTGLHSADIHMYICTIVDMTKTKTIFRISQSETDLVLKVGTQAPHNFQPTGGQILLLLVSGVGRV